MSNDIKPGNETSEWGVMQWVKWVAGLLGVVFGAVTVALPASGAVDGNSMVVVVTGVLATVCLGISGKAQTDYIKGRSIVKAGQGGSK